MSRVKLGRLLKFGPDDATLLLGTRYSVPMEHCSALSQGVASASNNVGQLGLRDLRHSGAIRHCWKHLQHNGTAWNNVSWGHCPLSQGAKLHRLDHLYSIIKRNFCLVSFSAFYFYYLIKDLFFGVDSKSTLCFWR